jgi:uncharacterized coiled-coil protein SlyX
MDESRYNKLCEDIRKLKTCVYGYNGEPGLIHELHRKPDTATLGNYIKKPPLPVIIAVVTIFFVPVAYNLLSLFVSQQTSQYIFAEKSQVQDNSARLAVLEQMISDLTMSIADIRQSISRQNAQLTRIVDGLALPKNYTNSPVPIK